MFLKKHLRFQDRVDDLELLLTLFPDELIGYMRANFDLTKLYEVVLDVGYAPEIRLSDSVERLSDLGEVTFGIIDEVVSRIGSFNTDNRAGIERTLHRVSAIRNRSGRIIGLTCRVGRAIEGTIELIRDIIESNQNILFLGPPGIGKTTKLRETARVLSDDLNKRVIVVDTSNEIAGDGDIPHSGIGLARRMQVPSPDRQHSIMIEGVENHMPEVIIVDEIGTEAETQAARTIAERGVQLVATAHGRSMENLLKNPVLSDLLGGIQSVILGDEEAKYRGTQKTVLERKTLPTFDVLIEIRERDVVAIYRDVKASVDAYLRGYQLEPEIRRRDESGETVVSKPLFEKTPQESLFDDAEGPKKKERDAINVYSHGLNIDRLSAAIHALDIPVYLSKSIHEADMVLTVKSQIKAKSKISQLMQGKQIPLHILKENSYSQMVKFFRQHFRLTDSDEDLEAEAIREVEKLCLRVDSEKIVLEAAPRVSFLRDIQHEYVSKKGFNAMIVGDDPNCRLRIYPSK